MAVTAGITVSEFTSSLIDHTTMTKAHTVDNGTTLLLVWVFQDANEQITVIPAFDGDPLTLVRASTSSFNGGDMENYLYGLISPTAKTADITCTHSAAPHSAWVANNYIGTKVSATMSDNIAFIDEDIHNEAGGSSTTVLASGGSAGNALVVGANWRGGDGDPASNASGYVEQANNATGGSTTGDGSFYVAHLLNSAPSAVTITWQASDENAGQHFEIIAAAVEGGDPFPYHTIKQRRNGMKTLLTM